MDCSCYWGLLNEDFDFLYISKNMREVGTQIGYCFIRSSLFQIIEPTCIPKFKRDLETFKSIAGFNGVAIRIKARNFWTGYHQELDKGYSQTGPPTPTYITYSATMQVISPAVILALFHVDEDSLRRRNIHYSVRCFQHYDQEEINIIHASLENNLTSARRLPPLSSLHTSSTTPSILSPSSPGFPPFQYESRSLLIYDSHAPQILLAWPPENFSRLTRQGALPSPVLGHNVLFDPRDSSRLLSAIASQFHENRLHVQNPVWF
ncbi:hypothetical protein DSO57_1011152 [Entomophthora muscae]|uniref:Uncharacterized protein n=1 Tax=Entomophthora muscae TaxID=34485 RepID=A0ACC2SV71_9FUNG|nr:hypothetical protein DSO57_1011152 [Entomophthora muscae]